MNKLGIIVILIIELCSEVSFGLFSGDTCTDKRTKEHGTCIIINECPKVIEDLRKNIFPTTCGFQGTDVLVCCPKLKEKTVRKPGQISDEMCKIYSQYVWSKELSPTLLAGAEDIARNECPFDRLELVVGGAPASRKEFPHMVQLGYGRNPIVWGCGGSLISNQYVLTAAHCTYDRSLGEVLYARMGVTDLDDPENLQQYRISEAIPHPSYRVPNNYHDIALLKLEKSAQLNSWVRPACLYKSVKSPWSKAIASGWGKTSFGGSDSSILLRVVLELYNQTYCTKVYRQESRTSKLPEGIKDDLMICAGHSKDLKDTCSGDSGGPLQVYYSGGEKNMSCMYDIIGVTSFGKGCGFGVNIPGVYTRVANYLKWIEDTVWPIE